ncbi:MAG: sulfite exporter TauE/SafE family protein [Deltaproteobacteria bacterium]|nr:sulfite exporter TauE/SafE family protein [Deltaproteobacteria bacterium]
MNPSFGMAMATALWFGILTSISPCPLATNIAAVSYIGRRIDRVSHVLSAGLLYTLGRVFVYVLLGMALVASTQVMPAVANFLQRFMNQFLGPVLLIVGLVLLEIFSFSFGSGNNRLMEFVQRHVDRIGIWGAFLLGVVFALSFCPISAALFFGSLFSLAIAHQSMIVMPSIYGIGTAIPVLGFAILIAFSTHLVGKAYNNVTAIALWMRRITAVVFISIGIYYVLRFNLGMIN